MLKRTYLICSNAIPSKINYQGLITDGNGSPIVSETNTITTNLYSSALDERFYIHNLSQLLSVMRKEFILFKLEMIIYSLSLN